MAIFLLVFTLLMAFLAITLLLGIAPISSKAKSRTMYVSATKRKPTRTLWIACEKPVRLNSESSHRMVL